jgi:hypothetical protein
VGVEVFAGNTQDASTVVAKIPELLTWRNAKWPLLCQAESRML